ncbi:hypothetical protein [Cellulomonas sp. ATA003]|uniref:hypothetical protein n=1 Tax=Cellulomonas sp. ATA003 TaxID=3073064 RepID=UPI002873A177|nr:hypothetical protein [Cellulomonas sp. ATA003]WNB85839.1 hypothetical protein REH70_00340 [Cellulomonas sp. ATA003]
MRLDRALPAGDHTLVVRYAGDDRYTASEHSVRLTVAGIPPRPATASGGDVQVTVSSQTLAPAAPVSITADGFVPGETVVFVLYSEPVILGTAVADDDGRATLEVAALPAGTELGQHTVRAIGGTSERVAEIPVTVAAVPEAPAPAAPVTAPAGPVGPVLTAPTAPATTAPAPSGPARPTALARTGSTAGPLVGLSALLVLTGAAALVLARRRGGRTA